MAKKGVNMMYPDDDRNKSQEQKDREAREKKNREQGNMGGNMGNDQDM